MRQLVKQFGGNTVARGVGAIDTPNYVSLTVQDPDGADAQISGIERS